MGQAGMPTVPITSCNDMFPFLGTWKGNVLDFYFTPLEPLKLELVTKGDETVGTFTIGTGDPLPPPTDADTAWPPGYWDDGHMDFAGRPPAPITGFPYTVVRGAGCDSTLRFSIASTEAWQDWCALQTPVYSGPDFGWGCILRGNGASSDGVSCTTSDSSGNDLGTYPVWKCSACGIFSGGMCACDENGCFANTEPTQVYDLSYMSGTTSVLSGKDPNCPDCTDRLERQ